LRGPVGWGLVGSVMAVSTMRLGLGRLIWAGLI
jgi:hypothetical protein